MASSCQERDWYYYHFCDGPASLQRVTNDSQHYLQTSSWNEMLKPNPLGKFLFTLDISSVQGRNLVFFFFSLIYY